MLEQTRTYIEPPDILLKPLNVTDKLLMGPGPSNCSPEVRNASSQQLLGHLHKDFLQLMHETKAGIKYAFQTKNAYTFAVSGTGHLAMEAALCNILEPGETCICTVNGIWGERAADIAFRHEAHVKKIYKPFGIVFTLLEVEEALAEHNPSCLFLCHGDTSTGTMQPLEGFGELCHKYSCLLIIDTVASLAGVPFFMDKWEIDVAYSGSQKVLGAPPGLSPISFSPRALEKIENRKLPVQSFYLDALLLGNYWGCDDQPARYHHTGPINLVYALREALAHITKETLEKCWQRHQECADMLYEGLEVLGLQLFVQQKVHRLPTVTTVSVPEGVDWKAICDYAMTRYKLEIAGGLGPTAGKVWRIGLMGFNCTTENVKTVLRILEEALLEETKSKL